MQIKITLAIKMNFATARSDDEINIRWSCYTVAIIFANTS